MMQRGLRVTAQGKWEISSRPLPALQAGEVRVATEHLGICGSDLRHIYDLECAEGGTDLGSPGHEIAGRVIECPSGRFQAGQHVLVVPVPAEARGFVDVMHIHESRVLPLGTSVGTRRGVLCQQVGTVIHAMKRFWPGAGGETAVVIGGGSAGQMFVAFLKRRGFRQVVVAERWDGRLDACRSFGADVTVRDPEEDVSEVVREVTGGRGAKLVVEAAGTRESRWNAMKCVGLRGTVGFFGLPSSEGVEDFPFGDLFYKQARLDMVVGTQSEPGLASFREAIELVTSGGLEVDDMVSHRFPLGEIGAALELARRGGHDVRKVLVELQH